MHGEKLKKLRLEYVPLAQAVIWDENPKEGHHDLSGIIESIRRHGFRDPPEYDGTIDAIVAGNGRVTALNLLRDRGEECPLYCENSSVHGDGEWIVPILFGADSASMQAAKQYAVDHNLLTLGHSQITADDVGKMFDAEMLKSLFQDTAEEDLPLTVSREILDALELPEEKQDISLENFDASLAEGFADARQFGVRVQLIVDLTEEQSNQPGLKEGLKQLAEKHGFSYKIKSRK
jgi:hypothetical protein